MKVIVGKKNSHRDYVNVAKAEELAVNTGKGCNKRDLPCDKQA